jgi:hypothetical protein
VTEVFTRVGGTPVTSKVEPSVIQRSIGGVNFPVAYVNVESVPVTIGGITAGTTFPQPKTMKEMWDTLLYPYQAPAFSSFTITGQVTPIEVGYTIPAAVTFTWATTNSANVTTDSVEIRDTTQTIVLATALANDGTEAVTMPGSIQKVVAASHVFTIEATNTQTTLFNRTYTVTWRWRLHYGTNVSQTLTDSDITGLASSQLATGYAGSYACAAGGYKYISFANAAGSFINSVKDASTGFSVPMATAVDNAAYSNTDGGGFAYALVSHTNVQGVTTNYRVYRTKYVLGGAVTLNVT